MIHIYECGHPASEGITNFMRLERLVGSGAVVGME